MGKKTTLTVIFAAAWICLFTRWATAHDPWYLDVGDHWARPYIRVLWEESITDGWVLLQGSLGLFQPDQAMTRAQYAVQLAKVFRLQPSDQSIPYEDVTVDLTITGGKPAYVYLSAAFHRAILPSLICFCPNNGITREDAVDLLMNALGLRRYIEQLTPLEVALLLHRFPDHHSISEYLRPTMAAATKLGIIQGYDDGSLRPQRLMTRAEAITIICRSCALLIGVDPDVFSPDGDGIDETTTFSLSTLKNRNITRWNLNITDSQGALLHSFNPHPNSYAQPPDSIVWDGRQGNGQLLPPSIYYARGWVRDAKGMLHWSVAQPVEIREYRIWGYVAPRVNHPGTVATVSVGTNHPALKVMWREGKEWFSANPRSTGNGREWTAQLPVAPDKPDGIYVIVVSVEYDREIFRHCLLTYEVYDDLALLAWLEPNALAPGQDMKVMAETSALVTAVTATFPNQVVQDLQYIDGRWVTQWTTPASMPVGLHSVVVTAFAPGRERTRTLPFTISRDPREDVTFIIID